jgi:hypothetical protein
MQRWLEVEKDRGAFVVVENEYDVVVRLAGLELNGTIDRIDELADGTLLLIDYKTGRSGKGDWLPQLRIVDPQLPAYAVTMDVLPGGVTFARLRPDDLKYNGLSDRSTDIDGIVELSRERRTYKAIASWDGLLAGWRSALTALADDFKQGVAVVDPRKPTVCGSCHLTSLCRIVERGMHLNVEEIDGDE